MDETFGQQTIWAPKQLEKILNNTFKRFAVKI